MLRLPPAPEDDFKPLGPAKPREVPSPPAKTPVPGKPHFYQTPDGKLSYEPPEPKEETPKPPSYPVVDIPIYESDPLPLPAGWLPYPGPQTRFFWQSYINEKGQWNEK